MGKNLLCFPFRVARAKMVHCILVDSCTVIMLDESILHFGDVGSILSLLFC